MKPKIRKLSNSVINQIAAGEVVENPASIVKELVENSLDAQSKEITISTIAGGLESILIEDDGIGMNEEDARMSIERHATSKIQSAEDLNHLVSMGFRGEALAAISSVSHFEMKTCDGTDAVHIIVNGGQIEKISPCARNQGTSISIQSLFHNVPARKKFQKSVRTNSLHIKRVVESIAMAHPDLTIHFNDDSYFPESQKSRIEKILGLHEHSIEEKKCTGYIASPSKSAPTRTGQFVFINHRPVYSPLISKAVKEAFSTRIAEHSYPRFVLFLELPPDEVDFNVHPQKKEVRFKDDGKVFRMVRSFVERIFQPTICPPIEPISFTQPETQTFSDSFLMPPFKVEEPEPELDFIYKDKLLAVLGKFLLLEREKLVLVDLSAAKARILFEQFKKDTHQPQNLMIPVEIQLQRGDEEKLESLTQYGVEWRILRHSIVIDALPSFLDAATFPEFFSNFKAGKNLEDVCNRYAFSRSKAYSVDEAMLLWAELQKCKDGIYDPMGHPIYTLLGEEELKKVMEKYGATASV